MVEKRGRGPRYEGRVKKHQIVLALTRPAARVPRPHEGFTLIEILVVLAIMVLLMSLAVPRYFQSIDRSRETVLKQNLFQVRESLDKYFADTGSYPEKLDDLVTKRYLRAAPVDPLTDSTSTWIVVRPKDPAKTGVYDIRSGAPGKALDGTAYADW
jgi:general secretion pathway protein G